ncbi:MAG: DAK2 domain-containing protein [Acidimicrobiales bacterium]
MAAKGAYEAVGNPVEGTILTVVREAAEGASAAAAQDASLVAVLDGARTAGHAALARTPELLPVLAAAGVVDAGGTGLLLLLDAFLLVADGRPSRGARGRRRSRRRPSTPTRWPTPTAAAAWPTSATR